MRTSTDTVRMEPLLIQSLRQPNVYPHPVRAVTLIETHISWVLLTGRYAYKIKKPVNLGFLDFSTLEQRRFFCEEELRLNQRFAPQLVLDVIAIHGTPQQPQFGGTGPVIEYAVKMREFPQDRCVDVLLAQGALTPADFVRFAHHIAQFHAQAARAPLDSPWGSTASIHTPVLENFAQIRASSLGAELRAPLDELERWSTQQLARHDGDFDARKTEGQVRECHGDLHARNLVLLDEHITAFDCIEFNPNLRWIDVISEVAFLCMDLQARGHAPLAHCFLNAWLEHSGDYSGLAVLRFYLVYRALVRAKVAVLSARKSNDASARDACADYLRLAQHLTQPALPVLILMHGLSGSGKSTFSQYLVDKLGAIRVRSDVERKRMFAAGDALYQPDTTHQVYQRLADLARSLLSYDYVTVIDATFLTHAQRDVLRSVARSMKVPLLIVHCQAEKSVLTAAVEQRARLQADISDATVSVLEQQIAQIEPVAATEADRLFKVDVRDAADTRRVLAEISGWERFSIATGRG